MLVILVEILEDALHLAHFFVIKLHLLLEAGQQFLRTLHNITNIAHCSFLILFAELPAHKLKQMLKMRLIELLLPLGLQQLW